MVGTEDVLHLLYIDDNLEDIRYLHGIVEELSDKNILLTIDSTVEEAIEHADVIECIDAIVFRLANADDGLVSVTRLHNTSPWLPIIVVANDEEHGIQSIKSGARDFLEMGKFTSQELFKVVSHAKARAELAQAMSTSQHDMLTLVEQSTDGLLAVCTDSHEVLFENAFARRMFEDVNDHHIELLIQAERHRGSSASFEVTFHHGPSNAPLHIRATSSPTTWRAMPASLFFLHDMTPTRVLKNEFLENLHENKLLVDAMNSLTVSIIIVDAIKPDQPIEYVNPCFTSMTGYTADEAIGKNCRFLQGPGTSTKSVATIRAALSRQQSINIELLNYRKDGTTFWNRLVIDPVFNHEKRLVRFVGVLTDVTQRRRYEAQIQEMAFHDTLTHLPNSAWLFQRFSTYAARALLYIDLDLFSHINEAGSFELGDSVLCASATRLRELVQDDGEVCRVGGDEFVVIVNTSISMHQLESFCQKLISGFRQPLPVSGEVFYVTASIGVASNGSINTRMKTARVACDWAKELGRNQFQIGLESTSIEVFKRASLTKDIHQAMELDQFTLHYQPRVHTFTGEIIGCEALLRWEHPDWGHVAPTDFISILETSGLIVGVGEWIIEQICQQIAKWDALGLPKIKVSFNVSPRQILNRRLTEVIPRKIEESGIDARQLELEITENAVMKNEKMVASILEDLSRRHISIAVDDFGNAYSSLHYLTRFPINTIKLDKSFVDQIDDERVSIIIRHIAAIARELGLRVVVEGVETEAQLTAVRDFECDEIQGFYYSRPVPQDDFESLLRHGLASHTPFEGTGHHP